MGAAFNRICYASNEDAADAFFLSAVPAVTSGPTAYVSWFHKSGSQWLFSTQAFPGSLTSSAAVVPVFPSCDPAEAFLDGHLVGWGVATAIIAAWLIKNLRRGL